MKILGKMIDWLSGHVWTKRLLAIAAILGAVAALAGFPEKVSEFWARFTAKDALSIAHLDEFSSTARLGDGSSGVSKVDRMYWPLTFSILNPSSEVISIEEISVRLPTSMADSDGNRIWIENDRPYRHQVTAAGALPALEALVRGDVEQLEADRQALPIALSGGEKLYIFNEMSFQLPHGFGFRRCGSAEACSTLLIRALGSAPAEGGGWRCPHGQFELSVRTRDHGQSSISGTSLILVAGCILYRPG